MDEQNLQLVVKTTKQSKVGQIDFPKGTKEWSK